MIDLGTLPGDYSSTAQSINDLGQVVGQSCDVNGNCRAFLWQDGVMTDLNTLMSKSSSLHLLVANWINARSEIVGQAFDQSNGETPAFLAIPTDQYESYPSSMVILPDSIRERFRQRRGFDRFATGVVRPQ
jgi:probable HAF family extracellular repeat protein